jgi:HSP20 family protein
VFDLVERTFPNYFDTNARDSFPRVDVKETSQSYVLDLELPGFNEDNVDVNLEEQVLTISAKREDLKEAAADTESPTKWLIRERRSGSFTRRFVLPADAEAEQIAAHSEKGVLTITVPRKSPPQSCRIPITAK